MGEGREVRVRGRECVCECWGEEWHWGRAGGEGDG